MGSDNVEQLWYGSQPYPRCATGNDCQFSLQFLIFGHRRFPHSPCNSRPKKTLPVPAYGWLEVNSANICWLNPFTKACSPGPGFARRGFAASTRISSASFPSTSKVSEMN
jgi:hypothetical protein